MNRKTRSTDLSIREPACKGTRSPQQHYYLWKELAVVLGNTISSFSKEITAKSVTLT